MPITRDKGDGVYFLDVISDMVRCDDFSSSDEEREDLEIIMNHINAGYESAMADPQVFKKYKWLCRQWDKAISAKDTFSVTSGHGERFTDFLTNAKNYHTSVFDTAVFLPE